jgi:sulfite reductase alpha subunit-like flavoprotein
MGNSVREAILEIIEDRFKNSREEAKEVMKQFYEEKRIIEELWG